jgi:hypothetical protein
MRGRTRVHIPICVGLLQRHCVENICQGSLVPGRRWVRGTARTIGAIGVGAVEVTGRRSNSEMCLCSTRKRWRQTGLLLVERSSARAGTKDALARHRPHLEVAAPRIRPWTGGTLSSSSLSIIIGHVRDNGEERVTSGEEGLGRGTVPS